MTRLAVTVVRKYGSRPKMAVVRTLEAGGRKPNPSLFNGAARRTITLH